MFNPQNSISLENATAVDFQQITEFIDHRSISHQHLDWSSIQDCLETDHFFIARDKGKICGVIAIHHTPEGNNWVKLFSIDASYPLSYTGRQIFLASVHRLRDEKTHDTIFSLALWDWYEQILESSGCFYFDSIITLERVNAFNDLSQPPNALNDAYLLPITIADVQQIFFVDQNSFSSPWQLSKSEIINAIHKSDYAAGVFINEKLIGYQISSVNQDNAHINRIGVLPEYQNNRIGSKLLTDIFSHYKHSPVYTISVNTQASNVISQKLYLRHHFQKTNDIIPVYGYKLS